MAGLQHQHQMDAWNSDLSVVEGSTEELTSGRLTARRRSELLQVKCNWVQCTLYYVQVASQPSPVECEFRAQHQSDVGEAGKVEHGHHGGGRGRAG